jgi:hypothetical protein
MHKEGQNFVLLLPEIEKLTDKKKQIISSAL